MRYPPLLIMENEILGTVFAPLLLGFMVATALYGITCGQVIRYYSTYNDDLPSTRMLVGLAFVMDTVQQLLMSDTIWFYLIYRSAGDSPSIRKAYWSLIVYVVPTETAVVIVQCLFVRRIWIVSEHNPMTYLFYLPIVVGTLGTIGYVTKSFMFPDFENGSKYEWIAITTAGCRTITDLAIGVAICIALKAKAGLLWSNSFVKLIGDLAIVSGVLTSLASTAYLISLITRPSNLTYTGLYYVYGKLHVNTLLAGLNARELLRALAKNRFVPRAPPGWPRLFRNNSSHRTFPFPSV